MSQIQVFFLYADVLICGVIRNGPRNALGYYRKTSDMQTEKHTQRKEREIQTDIHIDRQAKQSTPD